MIDLYLLNIIINAIWYIFTIIFVLYRFTSFFNYIYNYIKFCSKLVGGINHIIYKCYTYIKYPNNHEYTDLESQINTQPTFFQKCKKYIKSWFYKSTSQQTPSSNNLYYTQQENIVNLKQKETELFNKNFNELLNSNISEHQSRNEDFNINIELNTLDTSKIDNKYFENNIFHSQDTPFNYSEEKSFDTELPVFDTEVPFISKEAESNSKLFYSINLNNSYNHNYNKYIDSSNQNNVLDNYLDNLIQNKNYTENVHKNKEIYNEIYNQTNDNSDSDSDSDNTSDQEISRSFLVKKNAYDAYILKNPYI